MSIDRTAIRAVAFDFGNTIVPFGPAAIRQLNAALASTLTRHYDSVDGTRLDAIRASDRIQPYERGVVENDLPEICTNLVRELYGREPAAEVLDDLLRTRYEAFLAVIELPEGVLPLLERLAGRYRLGLLSNYPDGDAVRTSMQQIGILHLFQQVVVSGDVGYCKPHATPFRTLAECLAVEPEAILFVGDNWLADVQGAKRSGMKAALITQHAPIDPFERTDGDHEPDLVIEHLGELVDLLLG